uniref:RNA-binding protein n=1 Tax=Strongyloides venezuelensis TaxID=75913 RepID=A0A0K0FQX6_STRVS
MIESISRACNLPIEIVMKGKTFYCYKVELFGGPLSRSNNCFKNDSRNRSTNEVSESNDSGNVNNGEYIVGNIQNNESNTNDNNVSGISLTNTGDNDGNIENSINNTGISENNANNKNNNSGKRGDNKDISDKNKNRDSSSSNNRETSFQPLENISSVTSTGDLDVSTAIKDSNSKKRRGRKCKNNA